MCLPYRGIEPSRRIDTWVYPYIRLNIGGLSEIRILSRLCGQGSLP